jgi:glycosyltransferase involved in cell wall biosynthesis
MRSIGPPPWLANLVTHVRTHGVVDSGLAATAKLLSAVRRLWRRAARTCRPHRDPTTQRLLFIDDRIPSADLGWGYGRTVALLRCLSDLGYPITFFPSLDTSVIPSHVAALRRWHVEVIAEPPAFWRFARDRAELYDIVVVSRPSNFAGTHQLIRRYFPSARLIYDTEALDFRREELRAELAALPIDTAALRQQRERAFALLRQADRIIVVSDLERASIVAHDPDLADRVAVWGYAIDPAPTGTGFSDRRDLLFIGRFAHPDSPNEHAVIHFLDTAWPTIHRHLGCRFHIVGSPPDRLQHRASPVVHVAGFVQDLAPHYETARIFVVPHLYSGGIAIKLLDAMSRGLPSVVSALAAQQLGLTDGKEVLIGRTPAEFADKVIQLYGNAALWQALRENGLRYVQEHCGLATLTLALAPIIEGPPAHRRVSVRPHHA